jgi:alkanesulfonate monooxygenase SsuD/methylene tetrahydromethanopterin reductase-like flavin-dependent oxidoreductase (luciferase family)
VSAVPNDSDLGDLAARLVGAYDLDTPDGYAGLPPRVAEHIRRWLEQRAEDHLTFVSVWAYSASVDEVSSVLTEMGHWEMSPSCCRALAARMKAAGVYLPELP